MAATRICKGCGDTYSLDHLDEKTRAFWMREFPCFCTEDCEHFYYHPDEH